ncbi:MAG TPA: acyltransferase, partial [Micavibrio sp.]
MVLFLPASTPFPSEIHPLTSLRFYAALAISLSHILNYMDTDIGIHIPFLDFFPGYLGVDFFFILSGFILTHVYEESFRTQSITKTDFYIKRLARIYPLHALTLLMALELSTILGHLHHNDMIWADNTNRSFLLNLFLMHAWGMSSGASFNVPSWSISAEWFAYLL